MRIFYGKVCKKFLFVIETISQRKDAEPCRSASSYIHNIVI